jgi:hypothetical protein
MAPAPRSALFLIPVLSLSSLSAAAQQWGVQNLGNGCGGSGGPATMDYSVAPRLGTGSTLSVQNLPATIGSLVYGLGAPPVPFDLAALGMPGCSLQVGPEASSLFMAPQGSCQWSLYVPFLPVFQGAALSTQALFLQPGLNPAGLGTSNGVRAIFGPPDAPTTMVTQITQWSITWQFAQPVEAGHFANGDWFVIGPVAITAITPGTMVQSGRTMNGSMIDPDPTTRDQGYDSTLYGPYVAARNVALGVSAQSPLILQPGQALISVESESVATTIPVLKTAAILTCLATVPVQNAFRPPYAGTDHTVRYDEQQLDWSLLLRLPQLQSTLDMATVAHSFERVWLDHVSGWTNRYLHPTDNMPDYGRDLASRVGEAALMLHLNFTEAEKHDLLVRFVQFGIDSWGNLRAGTAWVGEGGHGSGRKFPILFAGAVLHDTDMLAVGANYQSYNISATSSQGYFGEDCQTFVVAETSPGVYNWGYGGYTAQDVGLAEWGTSHTGFPGNDHAPWGQDPYRVCCTANAWSGYLLATRMMGLVGAWNHQVLFDYQDRYMAIEGAGWQRSWSDFSADMWDAYRQYF